MSKSLFLFAWATEDLEVSAFPTTVSSPLSYPARSSSPTRSSKICLPLLPTSSNAGDAETRDSLARSGSSGSNVSTASASARWRPPAYLQSKCPNSGFLDPSPASRLTEKTGILPRFDAYGLLFGGFCKDVKHDSKLRTSHAGVYSKGIQVLGLGLHSKQMKPILRMASVSRQVFVFHGSSPPA